MVNDEVKLLLTYRLTELILQLEKATGKWTTEGSLSNWEMVKTDPWEPWGKEMWTAERDGSVNEDRQRPADQVVSPDLPTK